MSGPVRFGSESFSKRQPHDEYLTPSVKSTLSCGAISIDAPPECILETGSQQELGIVLLAVFDSGDQVRLPRANIARKTDGENSELVISEHVLDQGAHPVMFADPTAVLQAEREAA